MVKYFPTLLSYKHIPPQWKLEFPAILENVLQNLQVIMPFLYMSPTKSESNESWNCLLPFFFSCSSRLQKRTLNFYRVSLATNLFEFGHQSFGVDGQLATKIKIPLPFLYMSPTKSESNESWNCLLPFFFSCSSRFCFHSYSLTRQTGMYYRWLNSLSR
jgi:hypothetical protein